MSGVTNLRSVARPAGAEGGSATAASDTLDSIKERYDAWVFSQSCVRLHFTGFYLVLSAEMSSSISYELCRFYMSSFEHLV